MDCLSKIKSPVGLELERFRDLFDASLASSNPLLNEVIAHIRQRDGKMMRPLLVLLIAELCDRVRFETLHGAVALELLHTASLIHDDVVDESDQRRGQPSVNASFDNKVAVLVGDYLLATCLVEAGKTENRDIINTISNLGQDLSEGELLQLSNCSEVDFSEEIYFDVIRKKTAALFVACTLIGAFSVKADEEKCELARLFGEYIGICFQIRDDIFDYFCSEEVGKPTGIDMTEGRITLPALYVLNNTKEEWAREVALKIKNATASFAEIARLTEYTKQEGGIEYALGKMHEYHQKAVNLLKNLPDSEAKTSLVRFADYVIARVR